MKILHWIMALFDREPKIRVAASDSSRWDKIRSKHICDGVNDQVEIQKAIDDFPGGSVIICPGGYNISGSLVGHGKASIIHGAEKEVSDYSINRKNGDDGDEFRKSI